MPYNLHASAGDVYGILSSDRPENKAAYIAGREGIRYGISNMGDTFYNNGRFTTTGNTLAGAGVGALGAALNGGDIEDIVAGAGKGAVSGAASSYVASQGASSAGAGAAGGAVGMGLSLVTDAFGNHHKPNTGKGAQYAGQFVGALASVYLGPLGALVGAGFSKLLGQNPHKQYVRGELEVDGPLFKYNANTGTFEKTGNILGFKSDGFHYGQVPEKYWGHFTEAAKRRQQAMEQALEGKTFKNLTPQQAWDLQYSINSSILDLPEANQEKITEWLRDPTYQTANVDKMYSEFQEHPDAYLTRGGKIEYYDDYDGMDEGGDMAPEAMRSYLRGLNDDDTYFDDAEGE